jgi:hypothetical protein
MNNVIVDLPKDATARVNYMSVLASLENYDIPSSPYLSVQEFIASKMYNWYRDILPGINQREDIGWYVNYE